MQGVGMLWLTTLLPQTRAPPCDSITYTTCESATPGQMFVPCFSSPSGLGALGHVRCRSKASTGLFTGFVQVLVVSYKNRKLPFPSERSEMLMARMDQLWMTFGELICTAQKVEELKALLKVMPIWSTGIMMAIAGPQHLFPVLQTSTMDRHIVGGFEIPAASLTVDRRCLFNRDGLGCPV
ncbi:hypothetical protein V6N13_015908 [Hibiscus sabdariffa]